MRRSTVRSRNLVTTYFDTEDRRLGRRHLALRVRQTGKKFIQTLKTASSESSVETSRGEWEVELPDDTPLLTAFNDATVLDLVGLVLPDELQPTFQTRFRRQAVLVEWPDANRQPALIEVAFDRGAIRADGGEVPICEIELELKRGEPTGLVRAGPVDAGPGAGTPPAGRQGGARLRAGYRRAAGLAQGQPGVPGRRRVGRGRAAANPRRLRSALGRQRGLRARGA